MVHKNSNAGRLIDKLLLKELVSRGVCKNNRRKIEVSITSKGLALLEKIDPELDKLEKLSLDNLSSNEVAILNELLEKIRIN